MTDRDKVKNERPPGPTPIEDLEVEKETLLEFTREQAEQVKGGATALNCTKACPDRLF
jgi:hypothetical protein